MTTIGEALDLPEPNWLTCATCGGQYLKLCTICVEAQKQADARSRRIAEGDATIPGEYADARVETPDGLTPRGRAYLNAGAISLISQRRLLFVGPSGIGKTRLATALLRAWMAKTGQTARFVSAYRLGLVRNQHRMGDGDALLVDEAMGAALVLIDDLGQERISPTNALPDIVQHRHEQGLPTWVTCGWLDMASARESIASLYASDGIARRVIEGAKVVALHEPPSQGNGSPYDSRKRASGDDS